MTYDSETPWWRLKKTEELQIAERIWSLASTQESWRQNYLSTTYILDWLYHRDYILGRWGTGEAAVQNSVVSGLQDSVGWLDEDIEIPSPNIVKSTVDTVVAWLFTEQPPIGVRSAGVPFEKRFAVEEYSCAIDAIFNEPEVDRHLRAGARDASLGGFTAAIPTYENGQVTVKRLQPWQVFFNPYGGARQGNPEAIHVVEHRDREGVISWASAWEGIKSKQKKIRILKGMKAISTGAGSGLGAGLSSQVWSIYDHEMESQNIREQADRLTVIHSWRTSTRVGANDGRYIVTIYGAGNSESVTLIDQPFDRIRVPVCLFAPQPNKEGVWGTGYGHLMKPWQKSIDKIFMKIQRSLDLYGHIKILAPSSWQSNLNLDSLAESGITVMFVDGPMEKPEIFHPSVIRKEEIDYLNLILDLSQSIYGINSMMTRGASQLGAGASGVAQQEEYYRSLDRFEPLVREFNAFRLRLAEETLNLLDDVLKWDPEYRAKYDWRGQSRECPWARLRDQFEGYSVSLELRGAGAMTRAGRLAKTQEWASQGLIDQATATDMLLTTPDVRRAARLNTAGIRLVEWQIREILEYDEHEMEEGEDISYALPDKDTPLDIAIQYATKYIQLGRIEGAKPETLERLREYKLTAESLVKQMMGPPQPAAQSPGMAAQGVPGEMGIPPMG